MDESVLLRWLLLLTFVSVVIGYSGQKEKRDVHRIILKERRPRSHRSHHHRNHKHSHHHDHGSYEHYGKRGKHHEVQDEDFSFEHYDNSFEDTKYKSYHHSHRKQPKNKPHYSSLEYEDTKTESHRGWSPLTSSESSLSDSFSNPKTRRRPRKENKRYNSHLDIELTTKYPSSSPYYSFYENPDFFSFSQKTLDTKQSPLNYDFNNTYEVREHHNDEGSFFKDEPNFQVLGPMLEINKKLEGSNVNEMFKNEKDLRKTGRKRGRRIKVNN